jgi:hypothetical protein
LLPDRLKFAGRYSCFLLLRFGNLQLGRLALLGLGASVEQAEAIVMTLPHLLARATKLRTGSEHARYVFGLDEWSIERVDNDNCLIATLKTTDGFELSFGIPFEACSSLGWNLHHKANEAPRIASESEKKATANRLN